MECVTPKTQLIETFNEVREYSFKKKTQEEIVNNFLDRILDLQKNINEDSTFLEDICLRIEKLSWIDAEKIDEETKKVINDIISTIRDIHRFLLMNYVYLNNNARQLASKELRRLKSALDDVKEYINDFESIHFKLPFHQKFQEANDKLQSL